VSRERIAVYLWKDNRYGQLAAHPEILKIVEKAVGKTAILNLQNASAAVPRVQHFQSSFHRDFAQDAVSSKPLSVNAIWCIDEFSVGSGATQVVPFSHAFAELPSDAYIEKHCVEKHNVNVNAPVGPVIFWDSPLLHRTGYNSTERPRFGIDHMYTMPFLKQQMDFPEFLKRRIDTEGHVGQLFGFWAIPPKGVQEFRVELSSRTYRAGH
jgi:ectoine hydroxylase-related dioxygenase (phytanoyl-CoA dioxygenase family)